MCTDSGCGGRGGPRWPARQGQASSASEQRRREPWTALKVLVGLGVRRAVGSVGTREPLPLAKLLLGKSSLPNQSPSPSLVRTWVSSLDRAEVSVCPALQPFGLFVCLFLFMSSPSQQTECASFYWYASMYITQCCFLLSSSNFF